MWISGGYESTNNPGLKSKAIYKGKTLHCALDVISWAF